LKAEEEESTLELVKDIEDGSAAELELKYVAYPFRFPFVAQSRTRLVFDEAVPDGTFVRLFVAFTVKGGNETMWKEFGLILEFVKLLIVGFVGKEVFVKFKVTFVV
jgi:hypothetical protein